jgi:hypothetical protein
MQIIVIALKYLVRFEVNLDIQIARRAAVDAGFTFA